MARSPIRGFDGARLRAIREKSKLTRAELARRIGSTEQSIKMWETHDTTPSPKVYVRLSDYFGQDKWYFAPVPVTARTLADYRQRVAINLVVLAEMLGKPHMMVQMIEHGMQSDLSALTDEQISLWAETVGLSTTAWYQVCQQGEVAAMSA